MRKCILLFTCILISSQLFPKNESIQDTVEVYLIDNFVTQEKPLTLIVSFSTSTGVKSEIIIDGKYKFQVSKELSENHQDSINISDLKFSSNTPHFVIALEDSLGRKYTSEKYEIDIPKDIEIKQDNNLLLLCLFGGTVFILPYPVYVYWNGTPYFSFTKEIPLVFLRSGSFSYPMGYFSLEYSFIYHAPVRNFMRLGYKHMIEVPGIEYISPGINGVTNFNGYNGISPELSIGWFKIFNTFTLYSRFRYNFKPGETKNDFTEISIGLYSGFFAIYF
jgi:hypothetical protein